MLIIIHVVQTAQSCLEHLIKWKVKIKLKQIFLVITKIISKQVL